MDTEENRANSGPRGEPGEKILRDTHPSSNQRVSENSPASGRGRQLWQKGQSGNPGGRPKAESHVRELARAYGPSAIRCLAGLMRSRNERVAVAACQALLDRGYGKPAISLIGASGPLVNINLGSGALSPEQAYAAICGDQSANIEDIFKRVEIDQETVK